MKSHSTPLFQFLLIRQKSEPKLELVDFPRKTISNLKGGLKCGIERFELDNLNARKNSGSGVKERRKLRTDAL